MAKEHWRHNFAKDAKELGHWDLEEDGKYHQVLVTIEKFYDAELVNQSGKQMKRFVKLKEFPKHMVCNISNFKRLQKRFNSISEKDYLGKTILLGVEKDNSPDGKVDCLRFLSRVPPTTALQKKSLNETQFQKACDQIQTGDYTKEKLKNDFALTEQQITKLDTI